MSMNVRGAAEVLFFDLFSAFMGSESVGPWKGFRF